MPVGSDYRNFISVTVEFFEIRSDPDPALDPVFLMVGSGFVSTASRSAILLLNSSNQVLMEYQNKSVNFDSEYIQFYIFISYYSIKSYALIQYK